MNLENDLIDIIKRYFSVEGISYEDKGSGSDFATRYLEMHTRRIYSRPRAVYFSDEIHDSLGDLARQQDEGIREEALDAWHTVFRIWHLLVEGQTVLPYLSERVSNSRTQDWILWDYGMHHFHLNSQLDESGIVKRSDYLLLVIVTEEAAYFVDVRLHRDLSENLWVRQDLLPATPGVSELTAPTCQSALGGQQVTQQQQRQTLGVLGQTPVADFGIKNSCFIQEGMLHFGPNGCRRFFKAALLPGSSCRRRPGFIATCQQRQLPILPPFLDSHVPSYLRSNRWASVTSCNR